MYTQTADRVYDDYFYDVSQTQMPVSALDEHLLFYRYHELNDTSARERLINGNLRFVVKTARQFYHGDPEFLKTLIAAGNLGLLTAVERYRQWVISCPHCQTANYVKRITRQRCKVCSKRLRKSDAKRFATRFLTYAHWWIVEAIRTELYSASVVYIPPYKQKEHNRRRRNGEVVGPTCMPYDETEVVEPASWQYTVMQHIVDSYRDDEVINNHTNALLHDMLARLNARQAYVLIAYYGLREEPKNLREIAATLGVCSERVRQIKERGIEELRRKLGALQVTCTADA